MKKKTILILVLAIFFIAGPLFAWTLNGQTIATWNGVTVSSGGQTAGIAWTPSGDPLFPTNASDVSIEWNSTLTTLDLSNIISGAITVSNCASLTSINLSGYTGGGS